MTALIETSLQVPSSPVPITTASGNTAPPLVLHHATPHKVHSWVMIGKCQLRCDDSEVKRLTSCQGILPNCCFIFSPSICLSFESEVNSFCT